MPQLNNKRKLTNSIFALLALGLLLSAAVSYFHAKSSLRASVDEEQQLKAGGVALKLSSWLADSRSLVGAFADTLANSNEPIRDNRSYDFYLQQTGKSKQLDYLGFALEEDGYYRVNDWEVPADYDPRQRDWYQLSKRTLAPVITPLHAATREAGSQQQEQDDSGIYMEVTAPIIRDSEFLGVVVGEVTLDYVQTTILNTAVNYHGFAFLVDESGTILIHPIKEYVGQSLLSLGDLSEHQARALNTSDTVEGKEQLYSFASVEQTQWVVVVAADKASLNSVVTQKTVSLLVHFLAIFLLVAGLFALSNRRIYSPLIDVLECDPITKLPNKKNFKQQVVNRFLTPNLPGMLVIVCVEDFNSLTAAFTHADVHQLLLQMRNRLQSQLAHSSLLGQFSESRFIAYMNWGDVLSESIGLQWLESVVDTLSAPYALDQREIHCTFNVGACCFPDQGQDIEQLIDNCFSVIASERRRHFSNCGIFMPSMNQDLGGELLMTSAMKNGLVHQEFYLQYQPQYDYQLKRIVGLEALIRWRSKELGRAVSPAEFIPIAEHSALIVMLGNFVIDRAIKQVKQWHDVGLDFGRVSINISPKQLLKPGFKQALLDKLAQYDVSADELELEITETSVLDNPQEGIAILQDLVEAGFHLAVDDFGTGYSSFEYLKSMPIGKLKIDRAFVRDLTTNSKDRAIFKIMAKLAKALDYQLLAEGVETQEQLDIVLDNGCQVIQGYYYSKPLDVAELERLLQSNVTQNTPPTNDLNNDSIRTMIRY